jgi:8-oxo-dGTP pyrophosphatase MutT (NUDIX family)
MTISLWQIEQALAQRRPRKKPLRRLLRRAAVAMILREVHGEAQILMIKRARHKGDPWSGQMAFPGGLMERSDRHGLDVARRETDEEIGLQLLDSDRCIGRLSELMTPVQLRRRALVISPYVFILDREAEFTRNEEVSEIVWVPIAFLIDPGNRENMAWTLAGIKIPLPCYRYQGRRIWGLSLMMLAELLKPLR